MTAQDKDRIECEQLLEMRNKQTDKQSDTQSDFADCLINKQAAIEAIVDCTVYGNADELEEAVMQGNDWNRWSGGVLEALEAVEELPSAQPEPQWIPCSERLPRAYDEYLLTWTTGMSNRPLLTVGEYEPCEINDEDGGCGEWILDDYIEKAYPNVEVIAWMPLPEPYRAERRTDDGFD